MIDSGLGIALITALLFGVYKYIGARGSPEKDQTSTIHAARDTAIVFLCAYAGAFIGSKYLPQGGPPAQAFVGKPSF